MPKRRSCFMTSKALLFPCLVLLAATTLAAQTSGCEIPDGMAKSQKLPCIRTATMMLDQPDLTPLEVANGPDFNPTNPEKTRFSYFTDADNIACYFRPHYAFVKVPG